MCVNKLPGNTVLFVTQPEGAGFGEAHFFVSAVIPVFHGRGEEHNNLVFKCSLSALSLLKEKDSCYEDELL